MNLRMNGYTLVAILFIGVFVLNLAEIIFGGECP